MAEILVLGGNGMAGHTVSLYLHSRGHNVRTLARKPSRLDNIPNIVLDAGDFRSLENILKKGSWDAVINCIGILNQFAAASPDIAIHMNSELPRFLAAKGEQYGYKLIHLSTDCVFAGNTGPYSENSIPDGKTPYDITKAQGEINDSRNLTFRCSIVGPDLNPQGIGLLNWFLQQTGPVKGFTRAIWTGVTTLELAKAMEAALSQNLCGLYHLVNNRSIPKSDLLALFNEIFRNGSTAIEPVAEPILDKTLICTRSDFDYRVPSYRQMTVELSEWMEAHRTLYPHYYEPLPVARG